MEDLAQEGFLFQEISIMQIFHTVEIEKLNIDTSSLPHIKQVKIHW